MLFNTEYTLEQGKFIMIHFNEDRKHPKGYMKRHFNLKGIITHTHKNSNANIQKKVWLSQKKTIMLHEVCKISWSKDAQDSRSGLR